MILLQAVPRRSILPPLGLRKPGAAIETEAWTVLLLSETVHAWTASQPPSWCKPLTDPSQKPSVDESGIPRFSYNIENNYAERRDAEMTFSSQALHLSTHITQFPGEWIEQQVAAIMANKDDLPTPPRATFPLFMELGVLAKFLGKELSKLPPPARAAMVLLVPALAVALGASLKTLRASFPEIPEPPDYFHSDPAPMTDRLIDQQVLWFASYFILELSNGGQ